MSMMEFERWILAAVLVMARIISAFSICPVLNDTMIPGLARRAAALAFAVFAIPFVHDAMPPGAPTTLGFSIMAFREVVIGFFIGFVAAVPFWLADNIGSFIDNQRGATMGEVYSPLSGSQVATTGVFFSQIVTVIFFASGAIFVFLGALYESFVIWPVFVEGVSFQPGGEKFALNLLDGLIAKTVVISAPPIILMFITTIGLGFVNRTAPQLNVFFLSLPIKSALGIAMLVVYLPYIMDMLMYKNTADLLDAVKRLVAPGG